MKHKSVFLTLYILLMTTGIYAEGYITDRCHTETFTSPDIRHAIVCPSPSAGVPSVPQSYYGDESYRWTYWLGGGNHAAFGTDSALYIRARKSDETCDYGYLLSDSIDGGISGLSFLWKQGGIETVTYDIRVFINDRLVGTIAQAGKNPYEAATALPDTFLLDHIDTEGKFVLKIENRTPYNGTANKGRLIIKDLHWCGYESETETHDLITGQVTTGQGQPVTGAVISDGFSVVTTGTDGSYSFPRNESTEFVFISLPEAYEMPIDADGMPLLYARVQGSGSFTHNFILTPFADGGKADSTHVMIGISDPQVRANYETWRFRNETVRDIQRLKDSYPEGTHFYGVVVGDLVWDWYDHLNDHKASCAMLGFPVFQVIGNHDHDRTVCGDTGADHYFKENFGPTYYSFNRGAIHYIVLDDIDYIGCNTKDYTHNITQNQIDWLKKDLEKVPLEKTVVLCVHAPLEGSKVANRETVYNMLAGRRTIQHIISGHHHRLTNYEISARLFDHTLGAAQGAFWAGRYCSDGAPNGYGVFEAGDRGYHNWYYKATGYHKDFQFNTFPVNSISTGDKKEEYILANVWNYDSKWTVHIYENGEKQVMQQYTGFDPQAFDYFGEAGGTRPNYPGSDGGTSASQNPGAASTNHMFSYKPKNPDAEFIVEVTNRFGNVYRRPVLKNMMVASFSDEGNGTWTYRQDFNSLLSYPNQFISSTGVAKGTFVQGHTPEGWYACTSGSVLPAGTNTVNWACFNYLRLDNGNQTDGWLYSYGEGNPNSPAQNDSDRSLGSLVSTNNRNIHFGIMLENNTGKTLTGLDIRYTGKQWRAGTNPADRQSLAFSYAIDPDAKAIRDRNLWIAEVRTIPYSPLSLTLPNENTAASQHSPVNGNDPVNETFVSNRLEVTLAPRQVILLRWEDSDDRGADHGLAIDDLTIRGITDESGIADRQTDGQQLHNIGYTLYFGKIPDSAVYLYDLTGRLVYCQEVHTPTLDLTGHIMPGLYVARTRFGIKKLLF